MSEFAGIIRSDGSAVEQATLQRLTRMLDGSGKPAIWRPNAAVALVERRGIASYDNGWMSPPVQLDRTKFVLATARLDDPRAVQTALDMPSAEKPDDRTLVMAACLKWGAASAAERLYGDFSLVEWDETAQRLTIARDAFGARPVYYVVRPHLFVFATTLQTLLALPEVPRELDEVVVAHTLTIALQDQEQTIYRHIRRAPPGGTAIFANGELRTARFYSLASIPKIVLARDDDYVEAGRALLDRAVQCRLSSSGRNAITLSGGFDSAGVAATAARLLGERRLKAFTRAAGADHPYGGFDEKALAGLLPARYPNIDWTVIDDTRESSRDIEPEIEASTRCVPRQDSFNATWFESLLQAIEATDADVILNGGVGNTVLSWKGEPMFRERFRSLQWFPLLGDVRGLARDRRSSLAHTVAAEMYHSLTPRAMKRVITGWRAGHRHAPWLEYSLISPDFLTEIDYSQHALERGHDIPFDVPVSSQEMRLRTLQAQRGRDSASFGRRERKAESRDPYTDRALVEFALGIPEDQYWRRGTSRWLARRVLADRVPAEILAQRAKGKQSPEWYYIATRRREATAAAVERLSRSRLASRVLDIPRMRSLLEHWPEDAEAAREHEVLYGHALQRAISMGGFLRWHEGGNE